MAGNDDAAQPRTDGRIALGDHVVITGGGLKRMALVQAGSKLRLGSSGVVQLEKLAGLRFGEVLRYDPKERVFLPTNAYPDLDITSLQQRVDDARDNRHLVDDNRNQMLSNVEAATLRHEKGVDAFLSTLVEKSSTFHTKTAYSQEKYLRKKKKRYGTLYKVERVTPDGVAEVHLPTINPSDVEPEETRAIRLRADTMALILHHSDVHSGSRVLVYDKSNGHLEAALLTRLGDDGIILQLMDKVAQPNIFPAQAMGLTRVRELWKAVPRNDAFLLGTESAEEEQDQEGGKKEAKAEKDNLNKSSKRKRNVDTEGPSQWLRGIDARRMLQERPADSLIIVNDADSEGVINELLPFLALGGHIVVFSQFLEDLSGVFARLWNDCVNICVSETWYRHHQVLPNRSHPTVNMSTAGGYLLTAIKAEVNGPPRPRLEEAAEPPLPEQVASTETDGELPRKRPRHEAKEARQQQE
ncbi:tRNA (adenine-N(1)-)-methyltransferase non-catalytic subunit [Trypanosoma conorhini]|uniref:tRNA (adenine(58)-N(1))-methyltransferase non-catalytic subunit TRM6 n=1 Tax=Trypanosoma conorhini TaxID=83891 RepID=A0A3R7MTI1_9TRYP|nr:tRNA (adenine-N(1)-)-methyltransferase non-catalytic subunit [Trypanosoma conorhini]RNF07890.1 tRNA (adenine-N(1)-)-methyltransferase non-catalytic subunit [Trypanosoma conorhini]